MDNYVKRLKRVSQSIENHAIEVEKRMEDTIENQVKIIDGFN